MCCRDRSNDATEIRALLLQATTTAEELRGLARVAIDQIEADQGAQLPRRYRSFLEVAGGGAGRLWVGSDAFYPAVLGLKIAAQDLLHENGQPFRLSSDAVVFLMHQGYQFFFLVGAGDDPPVYGYVEGEAGPEEVAPSFSAFLRRAVVETGL